MKRNKIKTISTLWGQVKTPLGTSLKSNLSVVLTFFNSEDRKKYHLIERETQIFELLGFVLK